MPSLGADMRAATLVEWYVQPGSHVKHGDVVADVETDKGVIEIEIFEDGEIEQILVQPGQRVPVGTVLATFRGEGAAVMPAPPPSAAPAPGAVQVAEQQPVRAAPTLPTGKAVRASPLARRLAAEHGIDLNLVQGTGPHGAIERADIERAAAARKAAESPPVTPVVEPTPAEAAAAPPVAPAPPAAEKPAVTEFQEGMRRAIAAAMARSNREIPHYYLETRIDMSHALRWLEGENARRSVAQRLLPVVLLIKAVARALGDVPELNGYWIDDRHQPQEGIHIGFAISLRQGGLIAPALHHADLKSLDELMEAMRDLITRVRAGRLRGSEMSDATITLTSLGDMGVETVYGVIYPPQVALVGFGKIREQPWVENGMLGIRPVLTATLAGDHRATDGHRGARFLDALNHYLQEADQL